MMYSCDLRHTASAISTCPQIFPAACWEHSRWNMGKFPRDDHDQACLSRRRQYELGNLSLWIISPEDFVLHKLKAGRAQDFIDVLSVLQR